MTEQFYRRVIHNDLPDEYEYEPVVPMKGLIDPKQIEHLVLETILALDAATRIGTRSCSEGDHLHYANHDRIIREWAALGIVDAAWRSTVDAAVKGHGDGS